eukprot:24240-Prymnesium_polylepis.1
MVLGELPGHGVNSRANVATSRCRRDAGTEHPGRDMRETLSAEIRLVSGFCTSQAVALRPRRDAISSRFSF